MVYDVTYYVIPRKYLRVIILVQNENVEKFRKIFSYLYNNYNFDPKIIYIDFNNAEIVTMKKIYGR